ncbi:cobalt-zinc-cadmium resistance protein CzcA [Reichenbachiella faecimaris]|uniref:Cobalt-zinc-cadmium resistance protein CzcA n=1 Tax=Reichenbachiella faecimaris TaxID=692418 RepID=A0A1W2G5E5_REIFA|nr:CusA/CzcA family heavy metal efflux RND transporter [Reichenbachiella faecimaris]SMD31811.1 cobalt-zinc-cadmium resistance protein CzcA [Reichenbachiella faecimaris]
MINALIEFSIKNKLLIAILTIILIVTGIWSITKVPLDAVPDITNNQVQVITQAPNLGTEDIEQFVTYPVEIAMSNLPGVIEIRSISRFGLSVVTIVFEDDQGTYLPRQLVAEKLTEVKEDIPKGFGEPSMGPISTGLGEIYQYTLKVDEDHQGQYTPTDLRTIQDWIVQRQMAMVPGVVEINAIGGKIKQYEVAIDPDKLKAIGITTLDVFQALENNNQNTGGAYIEKDHQANFIRGEGLARSLKDLENIVVKTTNGLPIQIKDVAKVQYGSAIRYGALTQDGVGEVVGGLVMMLKGANSNDVISNVKERMKLIQQSLPEGVIIEPLLDRSKLIAKTTGTVGQNLTEGALIVIFVLVFLLGNWRGGLIVASTIPLSLLFAFILMNVFDVWANLMSLGAIDFGIIVDGAVIIVESTVFLLHDRVLKKQSVTKELRDEVAYSASSKMMNSAFFGQLIILIVFIPILALEGVEGKMFQPMALTFMFAMIGVMILCLTYVPMMSAWFIRMGNTDKVSWGDRFVVWLENIYEPVLGKALKKSWILMSSAIVLLVLAIFTFSRMGGEFIPELDEGDLAFHAILKPGSSLTETIETTTKIEKLVKQEFPEVEKIVSRIGVAEVPTDPMPMDLADVFVILKPKDEWTSASSKDELVEKMKKTVEQIPGVNYEFTQPIEMRFNELLEGVREDIAIKLYGEDINILASKAEEVAKIIAGTPGIGDMRVEATKGLPQMTVKYNRYKLAQYGLNVNQLNLILESSFAGGKAGVIFEGEKRFDLVVRLNEEHRKSIDNLKNLYINIPNGSQIPLKEVAEISYQPGPMQISRDNTNRRIYVGINVRGRDVKSLVTEIQKKLESKLELPAGYYIRYGGAFENLERASKRLQVVVPVALGLIFLLIFFALKSFRQSLMIYMAIPLAAIGGVFALWLRGMPFSISAGVGFIVLFGVAVLNGLVLIGGWNELKEEGMTDLNRRIRLGAKRRIRPILLTALTDVLGFLPMAISSSAGAEVQRPLATVVIGGMITATFLTLFVLPVLYQWVESRSSKITLPKASLASVVIGLLFVFSVNESKAQGSEQQQITTLAQAIEIGLANNGNVQVAKTNIEAERQNKRGSFNPGKTDFGIQYGQYNSFENDFAWELNQSFEFPTVYSNQSKLAKAQISGSEKLLKVTENELKRNIKQSWLQLVYLRERQELLAFQDSLFRRFLHAANIRYETEASGYLEKAAAETRVMEIQNNLQLLQSDTEIQEYELRVLLNAKDEMTFNPEQLGVRGLISNIDSARIDDNPKMAYIIQQIEIADANVSVQSSKMLPGLSVGYFNQSLTGTVNTNGEIAGSSDRFSGIQAGISIPLFYGSDKAKIKVAKLKSEMAQTRADYFSTVLKGQYDQQLQAVFKYRGSLNYYQEKAVPQAELIIQNAQKSFENGAIDYVEYFQSLNQGLQLKFNYLNTINEYNQAIIELEYLIGQ